MQTLKGGGYSSVSGWVLPLKGRTTETGEEGKIDFAIDVEGAVVYRSYRVDDICSAPAMWSAKRFALELH